MFLVIDLLGDYAEAAETPQALRSQGMMLTA
jgi:hypothetical protein